MSFVPGPQAQRSLGSFAFKVAVSVAIASFQSGPMLLGLSSWLAVFGTVTAVFALVGRERFRLGTFSRWDEVLWLTAASTSLLLIHNWITP